MEENNEKPNVKIEVRNETVQTKNSKVIIIVLAIIMILSGFAIGYIIGKQNKLKEEKDINSKLSEDAIEEKHETEKLNVKLTNNEISNFDLTFLKLENEKKNKVYSPLSIKYALKMLEEGTNGETKEQISNVLKDYKLTKYTSNKNMSFANALFVKDSFKSSVKQNYITNLKNNYNAEVVYDTFASTKNINNWVKEKTLDIIPEILGSIDNGVDFLLVNALGIDMEWKIKFFDWGENEFWEEVEYEHENYYAGCNTAVVTSRKFDNNKSKVSGMEVFASMDNYDITKILGEDNIRKTVEEKYRAFIKEKGTNAWGESLTSSEEIEKEISNYLDKYMEEIKLNYTLRGEVKSIDFSLYTDNSVKVFAKDLKEYNGTTLQYIGIMPTNQNLDQYIKNLDNTKLNNIIKNLKELKRENFKDGVITRINGFIPKFNFEYTLKLKDDLAQLGIKDVFNSEKADLSELCSSEGEYISDVIHKANIEFTQDGIKAAAATVTGGKGALIPEFDYIYEVPIEEIDLTFDKPYMFVIRDKETGEVWFTGTVYEPLEWNKDETKF